MFGFRFKREVVISFIGFAAIVGIIGFYGYAYFRKNASKTTLDTTTVSSFATDDTYITYETLMEKRRPDPSKVILIDIRPNELFSVEHIPQSTNIPFDMIENLRIKDGFTFVLIASAGDEQGLGAMAAQILHEKNDNVPIFILRGGFESWKSASGNTLSFGNPELITDQVKVVYIDPEVLKKQIEDNAHAYFIIDMRSKKRYDEGHVPNAVNLPFEKLESFYEKIPTGVKIVAYGNSELEDFQAGVRLIDLGFFSTEVLKGGFVAWKDRGFDVQR